MLYKNKYNKIMKLKLKLKLIKSKIHISKLFMLLNLFICLK